MQRSEIELRVDQYMQRMLKSAGSELLLQCHGKEARTHVDWFESGHRTFRIGDVDPIQTSTPTLRLPFCTASTP